MGSPRDWMETVKETVERIRAMIGSPADTGGSTTAGTVMGKLNQVLGGVGAVKSVQRVDVTLDYSTKKKSMSLTVIDPSRCVVYFQLLTPPEDFKHTLNYALRTNALDITFSTPYASVKYQYIFWIIEFY